VVAFFVETLCTPAMSQAEIDRFLDKTIAEFRDYWIGAGRPKADWDATFRNRIRKLQDRQETAHASPRPQTRRSPRSDGRTTLFDAAAELFDALEKPRPL
jgi:hypothetical protein